MVRVNVTHRFHRVLEDRGEFGEHFVLRLDQFLPRRPREFLYLLLPVAAAAIQIGGFIHRPLKRREEAVSNKPGARWTWHSRCKQPHVPGPDSSPTLWTRWHFPRQTMTRAHQQGAQRTKTQRSYNDRQRSTHTKRRRTQWRTQWRISVPLRGDEDQWAPLQHVWSRMWFI